jgi:hypothetical protein
MFPIAYTHAHSHTHGQATELFPYSQFVLYTIVASMVAESRTVIGAKIVKSPEVRKSRRTRERCKTLAWNCCFFPRRTAFVILFLWTCLWNSPCSCKLLIL